MYSHFKLETFKHALDLISEGYWLASLDIKDAYFHVKIDKKFWKYLRFSWMVPCIALLVYVLGWRVRHGFSESCVSPLLVSDCEGKDTLLLFSLTIYWSWGDPLRYAKLHSIWTSCELGFVINLKKSVLVVPSQILENLVYILNTIQLILQQDKIERFRDFANFILSRSHCKIREVV